jgi:cyclin-dependent kinase 2
MIRTCREDFCKCSNDLYLECLKCIKTESLSTVSNSFTVVQNDKFKFYETCELCKMKSIDKGSFGVIKRLTINDKLKVIVKEFKNDYIDLVREFAITSSLHHPIIIPIVGLNFDRKAIIYKNGGYDLYSYIAVVKEPMSKNLIRSYVKQLVGALKYSHDHMIAHMDLKPKNVVLNVDGTILLIDYGISIKTHPSISYYDLETTTSYNPPEITFDERGSKIAIPEAVDMWCLGMCMLEMLTMKSPYFKYEQFADAEAHTTILSTYFNLQEIIPNITNEENDFLRRLLCCDPEQRMTSIEASNHPYIS